MDALIDAIEEISLHPQKVREIKNQVELRGLMDTPIRNGAWTPRQILHHLADSHINSYIRIKLALTEENPKVKPYNEKEWAVLPDVEEVNPEVSIQMLEALHLRITVTLKSYLKISPQLFDRTFFHPEVGERTIRQYVISFANHGISHLNGISKLLKSE